VLPTGYGAVRPCAPASGPGVAVISGFGRCEISVASG
jgi:hypothetical protein